MDCGSPVADVTFESATQPSPLPAPVGSPPASGLQAVKLTDIPRKRERLFWTVVLTLFLGATVIAVAVMKLRQPASLPRSESPSPSNADTVKGQQANQAHTPSLTKLTTDPSRDTFPVWSSNGKILFQSNRNSGRANGTDIWEMNPDGSGQREIVRVVVSTPPEWGDPGLGGGIQVLGPSGNVAVYEAQHFHEIMQVALSRAPTLPVVRTALDGNDEYFTQLLQIPGGQSASNIVFSNATQMAAWVATVPGQGIEIRAAELSGMSGQSSSAYGVRLAVIAPSGTVQGMSYSPNGSQLVAAICWRDCAGSGHGPDLYVLDSRSGQVVRQLTNTGPSGATNSAPQWSSNGDWIVFTSTAGGQPGLWLATADGSGSPPARIDTGNMQSHDASWSRDGFKIVFVGTTDGNEDIWLAENLLPRR
jgi:hypothetical protein